MTRLKANNANLVKEGLINLIIPCKNTRANY